MSLIACQSSLGGGGECEEFEISTNGLGEREREERVVEGFLSFIGGDTERAQQLIVLLCGKKTMLKCD